MDGKRNLVVIGNGMSGARVVEEILARDGATMFNITMFGDEPFGNYNRIMLANVLDGSHDTAGIFLNPLAWYEQNGIRLHAGVRVTRIFRFARRVTAADGSEEPYDNLIIATGSRSYIPPVAGIRQGEGRLKPGVSAFATSMTAKAWRNTRPVRPARRWWVAVCWGWNAHADCRVSASTCTSFIVPPT